MKEKQHEKKRYIMPVMIVTTVGVVGLCANKKVRHCLEHQRERYAVKRFVRQHLSDHKALLNKIQHLSNKQIHFLYRTIEQFYRVKQGIRLEGEAVRDNAEQVIQEIQSFLMEH